MVFFKVMRMAAVLWLGMATACVPMAQDLRKKADKLAASADMRGIEVHGGAFTLWAYERMRDRTAPVRIYIEGDGNAWLTRNQVSPDPTPRNPVALMLAVQDASPNVVYIARPCQYMMSEQCNAQYWTYAQFNETIIAGMNQAINRWKGHPIELVGYSGGAAVALLIAARRPDVVALRTVAGNVDIDAFVQIHNISPLSESLNPADYKGRTAFIPQRHFSGAKDRVVPPVLIETYQRHLPAGHCSAYTIVPDRNHSSGWANQWASLLALPLPCQQNGLQRP